MNSRLIAKVAANIGSVVALVSVIAAASGGAATAITACGESGACTNLRQTNYASLEAWQACDPASSDPNQCLIEPGNAKDCTGVLTCAFPVNVKSRAQAEMTMYTSGQASLGCYLCAIPNCVSAQVAICEPVSRRCTAFTGFIDGGAIAITNPPVDSGSNPTFDAAPTAKDANAE